MKRILLSVVSIIIISIVTLVCKSSSEQSSDKLKDKYQPMEDYFLARNFPDVTPDMEAIDHAFRVAIYDNKIGIRTEGSWEVQGPGNIGARINTVAVHPTNHNIILIGYSSGGIWKTINGGQSWYPVFDENTYTSVGSIAFDPERPNLVFAGTGDPALGGYPFVGNGLFKSTDGGETWAYNSLSETAVISRVAIAKTNSDVMYVAAMGIPFYKSNNKGVYKSNDGGKTWNQSLFINDSTGVSEVIIHPTNPNIAYAISWNRVRSNEISFVSGPDAKVFRTKNGGNTWEVLNNGLPEGDFTRMGLALAESNPDVLYVQYTNGGSLNLESIYKSTNGGDSWQLMSTVDQNGLTNNMGGFGWYFGKLRVNPHDEKDLFLLGVFLMRYDGTNDFWEEVIPTDFDTYPHADEHDLVFAGDDMFLATDGGLYKSKYTSAVNWTDIENIPTTQFYRVGYNPFKPNNYYGGAQDNGTSTGNSNAINSWSRIYGADGFQPVFNYLDSNIYYVETQNGRINVTQDGGVNYQSANEGLDNNRHWDMQYIMSNFDPLTLYAGTGAVYKSEGSAVPLWLPISEELVDYTVKAIRHQITTLSESPLDKNILYVGTTDAQVWNTLDGGDNWNKINVGLPSRYVTSIKASPSKKNTVYVTLSGYRDNDNNGHIFRSDNNGEDWENISSDLPPFAINDVLIYPDGSDEIIFAATDGGIYISTNAGENWERMGNNMPFIPVYDIEYNTAKNQLIAGTFARGIQTFDLIQLGIDLETNTKNEIADEWKVYPTVTCDVINIEGKNLSEISIIDSQGKVMLKTKNNTQINLGNYPNGIYYVRSKLGVKKVIKMG